jgi:hypothetical protein
VNLDLFFETKRILKFKKLLRSSKLKRKRKRNKKLNPLINELKSLSKKGVKSGSVVKLKNSHLSLGSKTYIFKITNLNHRLSSVKKGLIKVYSEFKHYSPMLFPRNGPLFLDLMKVASLLLRKRINERVFLAIIGDLFKNLHKRKQNRFIYFIRDLLRYLVRQTKTEACFPYHVGFKCQFAGRILGKTRANTIKLTEGSVKENTISSYYTMNKIHVHTIYGVYGVKLGLTFSDRVMKQI